MSADTDAVTDTDAIPDSIPVAKRVNHLWFAPRQTGRFTRFYWRKSRRRQGGTIIFGSCLFWLILGVFYLMLVSAAAALWLVVVTCIWTAQVIVSPLALVRAVRAISVRGNAS